MRFSDEGPRASDPESELRNFTKDVRVLGPSGFKLLIRVSGSGA